MGSGSSKSDEDLRNLISYNYNEIQTELQMHIVGCTLEKAKEMYPQYYFNVISTDNKSFLQTLDECPSRINVRMVTKNSAQVIKSVDSVG